MSKATKPDFWPKRNTSSRKFFPPQLLQVDKGHGRIEWRGIQVIPITPEQMGFPHVLQLARLDRIRQLSAGRQEVETVWLITSLSPEQADAARLLELARQYWSIENGTHYRLDVSAGEDRCRVRHPVATTVLGILYVFTRVHLLKNYQKNPLLRSDSISLRVLAPQKYYRHTKDELYNFGGLEKILSDGIGGFASAFVPGLKMDFKFTVFPEEVDWACKDKLLAALQGIKPLYEQQIT